MHFHHLLFQIILINIKLFITSKHYYLLHMSQMEHYLHKLLLNQMHLNVQMEQFTLPL